MKFKYTLFYLIFQLTITLAFGQTKISSREQVMQVYRSLELYHFSPVPCDDSFSTSVFNSMLQYLDPYHLYFTSEEIQTLEKYKTTIDDELKGSDWKYLDDISSLFKNKLIKTDTLIGQILSTPLKYSQKDSLIFPVDSNYYCKSEIERQLMWTKWLKLQSLQKGWNLSNKDSIKNYFSNQTHESNIRTNIRTIEKRRISRILNHSWGYDYYLTSLFCNAIAGAYDPHSEFFPPTEKENFENELSNEAWIFGLDVDESPTGEIVISHLMPGAPAWKSGSINNDDIILELQWENQQPLELTAASKEEVYDIFDQLNHEKLKFKIKKRDGQIIFVTLKKEKLNVDESRVKSFVLDGPKKIGYIILPGFYTEMGFESGVSCANDVAKEILKLKSDSIEGLILDLRYNGGGSVSEALDMSGIFINEGVLSFELLRNARPNPLRDPNRGALYDGPLILIVNGQSASASEILAGALQDYNRGIIVGNQTFGKATEQVIIPADVSLSASQLQSQNKMQNSKYGYLKVTVGKIYRTTGKTNQCIGVTPNIVFPDYPDYNNYRESNMPRCLQPDTVKKASYFMPLKPIPLDQLTLKSFERVKNNSDFTAMKKASHWMFNQNLERHVVPLNWEPFIKDQKKYEYEIEQMYGFLKTNKEINYIVKNTKYDADKILGNEEKIEGNSKYIHNIRTDIYTNESFNIICDYIELLKNKQ